MGLDLYCGNMVQRFGSYSIVHKVRILWIKAYSMWLKSQDKDNSMLLATIKTDNDINYKKFGTLQIQTMGFEGLYAFVYHSDCDGSWDVEEVEIILETLNLIKLYLKELSLLFFEENGDYYLEKILKHSLATYNQIEFY